MSIFQAYIIFAEKSTQGTRAMLWLALHPAMQSFMETVNTIRMIIQSADCEEWSFLLVKWMHSTAKGHPQLIDGILDLVIEAFNNSRIASTIANDQAQLELLEDILCRSVVQSKGCSSEVLLAALLSFAKADPETAWTLVKRTLYGNAQKSFPNFSRFSIFFDKKSSCVSSALPEAYQSERISYGP